MFKQALEEQHLEVRKKARTVSLPYPRPWVMGGNQQSVFWCIPCQNRDTFICAPVCRRPFHPHNCITFSSSIAAPKTNLLCFVPLQIHLPFDEAVKWVRTTGVDLWGWKSKEDWLEWLQQGEGVSQYIPTDPESYYGPGGRGGGKDGVWRGWDYWLGVGEYKDQEI